MQSEAATGVQDARGGTVSPEIRPLSNAVALEAEMKGNQWHVAGGTSPTGDPRPLSIAPVAFPLGDGEGSPGREAK